MSRRARVLVVDDEPRMGKAMERLMAPDHEVALAGSGHEALELIARGERFDVILCDLMMPGLSGMDLHDELARSRPEMAERLVFMTGGAYTVRAQEFLARVPNARLEKPFRPEALDRALRETLERGRR
jgi:two-component system, NtrC family, sensor kinase